MASILCIGQTSIDHARALRDAGHNVRVLKPTAHTSVVTRRPAPDVIVFAPAVPHHERNAIASAVKFSSPRTLVIMLHDGSIRGSELADAVLLATRDPANLARVVDELLATRRNGDKRNGSGRSGGSRTGTSRTGTTREG